MKPKWMVIGFFLGIATLIGMAVSWLPEGNRPLSSDNQQRSTWKINDLLYNATILTNTIGSSAANPLIISTNEFSRTTANATPYSPGDCIAPSETATNLPMSLLSMPSVGGSGYVTKLRCRISTNNCTALLNVWLASSTNVTVQADNAAYALYYTNAASVVGPIPVQMAAGTDCSYGMNSDIRLPFKCATTDTNLYYFVQTANAWTPIGGAKVWVELTIDPK